MLCIVHCSVTGGLSPITKSSCPMGESCKGRPAFVPKKMFWEYSAQNSFFPNRAKHLLEANDFG